MTQTPTELLRTEIERFLNSEDPEVLSIRGAWGAGKTYAWNRFLVQARDQKKIALNKYSYVSLFGLQSLDEVKYAIFEATVSADQIGKEPTLEALQTHTTSVLATMGRRSLGSLLGYFKNLSDVVKTVSFLSVTKQIVCIDDIERKGKNLRVQDVLGLISLLRERRNCKIVLILNDNELDNEDKPQLLKYQEKVIDSSLLFAPTAADCVDIALPNAKGAIASLAKRIITLDISNIRVIKKIERLVLMVEPLLKQYDSEVLEQAIQSLALLGWAHFGRTADEENSLIDYVTKYRDDDWHGQPDRDSLSPDEQRWSSLLDRYGFTNTDAFDLVLLDAVRNGFIDREKLDEHAKELDARHKAAHSDAELNAAWALVHDSFDDNEDAAITALTKAYTNCVAIVTPGNMDSLLGLLRTLGHDDVAKEGVEFYMQERAGEDRTFFDVENHPFRSKFEDPDLQKAFDDKLATFPVTVDPAEILIRIGQTSGWSNKDIKALCALTTADYKAMFKRERGERMRSIVSAAVGFERISNRGTEYDPIINNAREALEEIASESKLNKRRVNRLVSPRPVIPES